MFNVLSAATADGPGLRASWSVVAGDVGAPAWPLAVAVGLLPDAPGRLRVVDAPPLTWAGMTVGVAMVVGAAAGDADGAPVAALVAPSSA